MRIISGKYRGLQLNTPKNDLIRPTTDRVKEDVFNVIQFHIPDAVFLDLFAGSGAIGIEAFSRGAALVEMVESNKESIKLIKSNIQKLKHPQKLLLIEKDVEQFLLTTSNKYDIIFLDPPYRHDTVLDLLTTIHNRELLNPNGRIVMERGIEQNCPIEFFQQIGFHLDKVKRYSSTVLYFIRHYT